MIDVLLNILGGVINGVVVAALGYAKSSKIENFDEKKFIQTAMIGGFVGGFAFTAQMTYNQAYTWVAGSGMITIIEYVKKTVWRRIKKLPKKSRKK